MSNVFRKLAGPVSDEAKQIIGDMTLAEWAEKFGDTKQIELRISVEGGAIFVVAAIEDKKEEKA